MGYESKLYIVEKRPPLPSENKRFAEVIVSVCLKNCPAFAEWMRRKKETDCFIYADDGNVMITEDLYGQPLTETTVEESLALFEQAASSEAYRRYPVAIGVLRGFAEHREQWKELAVLHFGC